MRISLVIPTHDRPAGLAAAVESALAGDRKPDELIVVHDGPGGEPDLAGALRGAGVGYRYIRGDRPSLPRSRNLGIDAASGDVIVFGEDDLAFPPEYFARVEALYAADAEEQVGGIGAVIREPGPRRLPRRAWELLARWLGEGSWRPRQGVSRYVELPAALAGRLVPASRLSGGGLTLRREAAAERFDESFSGYALGEDMEFCFRAGRRHALFRAPELTALHDPAPTGRPDARARGRMYAANLLHIARRSTDGGAGTWLLAAYQLAGMSALYATWSLLSLRGYNARFAAGVVGELWRRGLREARTLACG